MYRIHTKNFIPDTSWFIYQRDLLNPLLPGIVRG